MIHQRFLFFLVMFTSLGCVLAKKNPQVRLPWGTWDAKKHGGKLYKFMNVRYGADPPRFGKPGFPSNGTIYPHRDSPDGISCIQIDIHSMKNQPGGRPKLEVHRSKHAPEQDEDCLFLDIYAPRKNFDKDGHPIDKLPVIVFFPGGAYAFGSKNLGGKLPLYSGRAILNEGKNMAVYVVGNYRLGAFGWLAGSYMETAGQPNAGLYDQALLLEWVQEYIVQAGGDPDRVTAWGQSTGGGSIMHHLTREGGTKDPLFHNVMVQSPAFEWSYDNSTDGTLDSTFRKFSRLAGCNYTYDIDCLRQQSRVNLTAANQELFVEVRQTGIFPIGPSVDGKWIRTIPATSFANGQYWNKINKSLISHVSNETATFTPWWVVTQETFDHFLYLLFPEGNLDLVRGAIRKKYNCQGEIFDGDFRKCMANLIRDYVFTCNTRQLFNAFSNSSYMMEYSFDQEESSYHGYDLIPSFTYNDDYEYTMLQEYDISARASKHLAAIMRLDVRRIYTPYLASFTVHQDPNPGKHWLGNEWPLAKQGEQVDNVMKVSRHGDFRLITDGQNTKTACEFWTCIAKMIDFVKKNGLDDMETLQGMGCV